MSAGRAKPSINWKKSKVDQASSMLSKGLNLFFRGSAGYTLEHNRPKSDYTKFRSMQRGRYGNASLDL